MLPRSDGSHRHRLPTVVVPLEVQVVCDAFLDLCDEALPGGVEGLYLHGSLGFDEWFAHTSDIDFVAVSPGRLPADVLHQVHEELQATFPSPSFDGSHLTWADLAGRPEDCPDVPGTIRGAWSDEGRIDVSPVTWHELAAHGVRIRGPQLEDVSIHTDLAELRRYTHDNLASYWADVVAGLADFPAEAGKPEMVTWAVLGTCRLHHLLEYDDLTSKIGAGLYAIAEFGDRWQPLVSEAICWRESATLTGEYAGREEARAADTIEFVRMVVEAGLAIRV